MNRQSVLSHSFLRIFLILLCTGAGVFYWQDSNLDGAGDAARIGKTGQILDLEPPRTPKDFQLVDQNGNEVSLYSFKGKAVLLNFWATWCPPCIEELPSLLRLAAKNKGKLQVLAISTDENWKIVNDFFAEKKLWPNGELPLTILLDPEGRVAGEFGASKYPETFFINSKFQMIRKYIGAHDWLSKENLEWLAEHTE